MTVGTVPNPSYVRQTKRLKPEPKTKTREYVPASVNEANSFTFCVLRLLVLRDLLHNFRGLKLISL